MEKGKFSRLFFQKFFTVAVVAGVAGLSGCGKEDASVVDEEYNRIMDETIAQQDINDKAGFNELQFKTDSSSSVTIDKTQFSDESLVVSLMANTAGQEYQRVLWYQASGPEAIVVSPESVETEVLLPSVEAETILTFRFVLITSDNTAEYKDASILVLPNEQAIQLFRSEGSELDLAQRFVLRSNQSYADDITFNYSIQEKTAVAGDYGDVIGDITLPAGQTEVVFDVALTNDSEREGTEYFELSLFSTSENLNARAIGVIFDNETFDDQGSSNKVAGDFVEGSEALIAVECSDANFDAYIESVCDSEACDIPDMIAEKNESEASTVLSIADDIADGGYRFVLQNTGETIQQCEVTVIWEDINRVYSARFGQNELLSLDFSLADASLLVSQPAGDQPQVSIDPIEISLADATPESIELQWNPVGDVTFELYWGDENERTLYSVVTDTSAVISPLNSGQTYCFHIEAIDISGRLLQTTDMFCSQVPIATLGELEFQLSWTFDSSDGGPDLDLHVSDPNDEAWSFANANDHVNPTLDLDDEGLGSGGPERMYWEQATNGTYSYWVEWFNSESSVVTYADYTLQVFAGGDLVDIQQGRITEQSEKVVYSYNYQADETSLLSSTSE